MVGKGQTFLFYRIHTRAMLIEIRAVSLASSFFEFQITTGFTCRQLDRVLFLKA